RRNDRVGTPARRLDVHARTRHGAVSARRVGARHQSRLGRGASPEAGLRRRHDSGRDRGALQARVAVPAGVGDRARANTRFEPARRGGDLVRASDHAAAVIETERLVLRRPTAADVADPPAFVGDPRVMEFLGGVDDDLPGLIQRWLDDWDTYPAGKL